MALSLKNFVPLASKTPTSFSFSTCLISCFFSVPFSGSFSSPLQRLDSLSQSHDYWDNTKLDCQIRLTGIIDVALCQALLITSRMQVIMRHTQSTEKGGSFSMVLGHFSASYGVYSRPDLINEVSEVHQMIINMKSLNYINCLIIHHSRNHSPWKHFLLNVSHS